MVCSTAILLCFLGLIGTGLPQRLSKPGLVRVLFRNTTDVVLQWNQPVGIRYSGFIVSIQPPSAFVEEPDQYNSTRREISRLRPGERYVVSIIGLTTNGRRSPPNNYELWSEPLPPSNLTLSPLRQIEFSYELFGVDGTYGTETYGVLIDWLPAPAISRHSGYDVQLSPRHGAETYRRPLPGQFFDATSRIFVGLVPGQQYAVTVRTRTGPPYSVVYSNSVSETTIIPPAPPYSVEIPEVGSTRAAAQTIGPVNGIYDELHLELKPDHGRISAAQPDPVRSSHDLFTINGLTPGTRYELDVYSVSGGVRSVVPYSIVFITSPLPPAKLKVVDFTMETVSLEWRLPEHQLQRDKIDYVVEIQDLSNPDPDQKLGLESVATTRGANKTVLATIEDLVPGVTYKFSVYTLVDGIKSDLPAEVIQTTIPPKPLLGFLDGTAEGLMLRVIPPLVGRCFKISVTYSPPLPGESSVKIRIHEVNTNISLAGLPRDERYSVHIRCISNHLEGPPLIVSSRAEFDSDANSFLDSPDLPRKALACLKGRHVNRTNPKKMRPADYIPPNACCGWRPMRTEEQNCCGSKLTKLSSDLKNFCCGGKVYQPLLQVCCGNSSVVPARVAENICLDIVSGR